MFVRSLVRFVSFRSPNKRGGKREIDAIINEIANKCEVDTCEIYLANAGEGRKLYIVKNINL